MQVVEVGVRVHRAALLDCDLACVRGRRRAGVTVRVRVRVRVGVGVGVGVGMGVGLGSMLSASGSML